MGLKITRASEPIKVQRLVVCIYGQPGAGKSSLAFTAESPLLLDFDAGAHRAANRKDIVRVATWGDVASITADDLGDYRTVIVDTVGRALDVLSADIIKRDAKMGRGGALSLQGFGKLKAEFIAWLKLLNSFGKDVVLIAHMDEQRSGDEVIERLDAQGASKNEVYKAADAMGRLTIRAGQRTLCFDPTDAAFGKNPGQLEVLPVPHPDRDPAFLGSVITRIKAKLNEASEVQRKAAAELAEWRTAIVDLADVGDFNDMLPAVKAAPEAVRAIFAAEAKRRGYVYDATAKGYRNPKATHDDPAASGETQGESAA